jgi:hypothetical protein
MKRFFCSECKRIRRQRRWPRDVVNEHSERVTERIGTCNIHLEDRPAFRVDNARARLTRV